MRSRTLKLLTLIFSLMWMSKAFSALLIGIDCPTEVYTHELFTCRVYATPMNESLDVKLFIHSAEGFFEVLKPVQVEFNAEPMALKSFDVNCWAGEESGVDALTVDATYGGKKTGALAGIKIGEPSLKAFFETVTAEAGKTKTMKVTLKGKGYDVHVKLVSPTSSISVSEPVYIDEVDGSKKIQLSLTPSPTALGSYTLYLYLSFVDEKGTHVLRYKVSVWVNPSFYFIGILFAALLAVVFLAYLGYRHWRGKKGKGKPSEAQ